MNSLLICVIIVLFKSYSNAFDIKEYYIEDYCIDEFASLSPEESTPIKLYLSRLNFNESYCYLIMNTTGSHYLEVKGFLGQLVLNANKSHDQRLHFIYNPNITEDKSISKNILTKKLMIVVENNDMLDNNTSHKELMKTSLVFSALSRKESVFPSEDSHSESHSDSNSSDDCKDSDNSYPKCTSNSESVESSGEFPSPQTGFGSKCLGDDCTEESVETYSEESSESESGSDTYSEEPNSDEKPRVEFSISGSNTLASNKSLLSLIAWIMFLIMFLISYLSDL